MYQYVESLRRKPDHHKQRVAVLGAGAVTGLIFLGWLSVILPSNTSQIVATSNEAVETSSTDNNTPIESLKRSTAQVYDSIKSLFANTASQVNLQEGYSKMKSQVQNGDIKIIPDSTPNTQ